MRDHGSGNLLGRYQRIDLEGGRLEVKVPPLDCRMLVLEAQGADG